MGQRPVHPIKLTSRRVLLAQVTDILPQERYSYGVLYSGKWDLPVE